MNDDSNRATKLGCNLKCCDARLVRVITDVSSTFERGVKMYEDPVFQSLLYYDSVSLWGCALSKQDEDWLGDVQDVLWESFEGHYIDLEEQADEFIYKILRLQKYTLEKAVKVIIRYCVFANKKMKSDPVPVGVNGVRQ